MKIYENEHGVLYQGDCLEVMKSLDAEIDLVLTDPPYLIDYKTSHRKNKEHDFCSVIANDNNPDLVAEALKLSVGLLKEDRAFYCFCSAEKVDWFKQELEKHIEIKNQIIWVKNNHTAGDLECAFGRKYEILFLGNKGKCKFNGERLTDVWQFKRVAGNNQIHQNQKPIPLLERCIDKHTNKGDLILDPFAGSGSTAEACMNTGRKFIIIEQSEKYCKTIIDRLENYQPILF